ncbi:hypothetical protein CBR_g11203 [Chara braunii]|uniref:Uncharacterized protein n=1 Tax=Chara braunii TaxID=69332 RepID=A0A388KQE6_CHABU|nr:hypothetical protein CBR_g11203 [Chara braunii]|eukprot:GBG72275.1 hypothetical protein CBR_g11203 [Chara braunii]
MTTPREPEARKFTIGLPSRDFLPSERMVAPITQNGCLASSNSSANSARTRQQDTAATGHRSSRSRQCMVLTRSTPSGMDQQPGETTEAYEARMLDMVAEFKQRAAAATSARQKEDEEAEEQRRLAEQQRQADAEAARKSADERHPIPWWRQFELKLDIHHVINPNRHAYLYSRSGGECQAWLHNMLSTHNVAVSKLHTKISWADLKAAWHKRFQVEPPELQAAEKLQRFYQNDLPSTDWITEYQRLASTPNLPSTFVAIKHFFIGRSCLALQNALTQVAETLTTSEQLFDKASQIIVTNIEAKNLGHSSAAGQGRGQHRPKVAVVAATTATDPSNEAASSEEGDRLAAARDGCLPGLQCATLCAHLHTYLAFNAPPSSPTDDEAAVGDILAYVTKVAHEFHMQRYDDNNAPLLYVCIQVGQASCNALLDSGATRSFISQSFIQRAGLGAQVRRKPNPTAIKLADGRMQQLLDRYSEAVPVYFSPHACEPVTFDVLDTDFDIILGMPWLASVDHTVNFHQRTLTVRDAFGAEVPCTIPLPHSSIRCQVEMAKSFRAACAYERTDEIGLCFLRATATTESSPTDLSLDPRVVWLLDEFTDIFESPTGVVSDRPISHEIILEAGAVPPKGCIYRMSEEELAVLRAQLDDLLDKGWIRPSSSPYGAPILFVWKKNKDLHLCIDYRKLNAQTVKNAGPLPRIDDLLERLGDAKFFSKLDLKSGYHQISIRPQDCYQSTFKTRYGHFEWIVMSFGLTNAPTTFQAAMTNEFRAMLDRSAIAEVSVADSSHQLQSSTPSDLAPGQRRRLELLTVSGKPAVESGNSWSRIRRISQSGQDPDKYRIGTDKVRLFVSCEDTGHGISANAQGRIFQEFTQADASTQRTHGGTGIGLTISKQLSERMGGDMDFFSELGIGTTFFFNALMTVDTSGPEPSAMDIVHRVATALETRGRGRTSYVGSSNLGKGTQNKQDERVVMVIVDPKPVRREVVDSHFRWLKLRTVGAEDILQVEPVTKTVIENGAHLNPPRDRQDIIVFIDGEAVSAAEAQAVDVKDFLSKVAKKMALGLVLMVNDPDTPLINCLAGVETSCKKLLMKPVRATALGSATVDLLLSAAAGPAGSHGSGHSESGRTMSVVGSKSSVHKDASAANFAGKKVLVMPRMDGYETTALIRKVEEAAKTGDEHERTPIYAWTADVLPETRAQCLSFGMDGFLLKPIEDKNFMEVLHKLFAKK